MLRRLIQLGAALLAVFVTGILTSLAALLAIGAGAGMCVFGPQPQAPSWCLLVLPALIGFWVFLLVPFLVAIFRWKGP